MSDDLISRQAAIDALEELKELDYELYIRTSYSHLMEDQWDFVIKRYKEAIKETPSVQPKTGHWIERVDERGDVYYECSNCEETFTFIDGTPADNLYNHCPNCGAKMEETENE